MLVKRLHEDARVEREARGLGGGGKKCVTDVGAPS